MLHITNGDAAGGNLKVAGVPGSVLPWRDILHEGPVPAGLTLEELSRVRVRFLAGLPDITGAPKYSPRDLLAHFEERDRTLRGHGEHDEVVLWFEHDLYDQLQLIQILAWFAGAHPGRTRLTMVCVDEYLGSLTPDAMAALLPQRKDVTRVELDLGARAWEAFTHSDPTRIAALLEEDTSALPFLAGALRRHLEQYPSTRNGLSRSENQALQVIAEGTGDPVQAWVRSQQDLEERIFLGDWTFERMIGELSSGPQPLVRFEPGPMTAERPGARFWKGKLEPTESGRKALAGTLDWVRVHGIDRWLGGVHLSGTEPAWRWNHARGQVTRGA